VEERGGQGKRVKGKRLQKGEGRTKGERGGEKKKDEAPN